MALKRHQAVLHGRRYGVPPAKTLGKCPRLLVTRSGQSPDCAHSHQIISQCTRQEIRILHQAPKYSRQRVISNTVAQTCQPSRRRVSPESPVLELSVLLFFRTASGPYSAKGNVTLKVEASLVWLPRCSRFSGSRPPVSALPLPILHPIFSVQCLAVGREVALGPGQTDTRVEPSGPGVRILIKDDDPNAPRNKATQSAVLLELHPYMLPNLLISSAVYSQTATTGSHPRGSLPAAWIQTRDGRRSLPHSIFLVRRM
ncbi:hypothetical protein B0T24DRAFT_381018 [Lasiosphaeria ovina]|uniref:Uncharacterized protein n=1 Tax=Lasiosphaeria ovina TaxID=92902 RepID=A0AAE0JZU9_9PEZI|nr:hypothetical protein B0T24DRAFT_381018 [Lasiosphaeria ovina]